MRSSWIRRWFLKQDDFTLWAIFIIFLLTMLSMSFAIVDFVLRHI